MIRFLDCMEKGHRFATWHRNRHEDPDRDAFHADWDVFTGTLKKRGEEWSEEEWAVMLTYAMAALRYDSPNPGSTRAQWSAGGLWSEQWGTFARDAEDYEEAA